MPASQVDEFLEPIRGPVGETCRSAAKLMRRLLPGAIETLEGRDIGFGTSPGYKGLVFSLTPHAKHATIGIWDGASLDDPHGLLEGKGKRHKHLKITHPDDLKKPEIKDILQRQAKRALASREK